jgi:hypothetical protein
VGRGVAQSHLAVASGSNDGSLGRENDRPHGHLVFGGGALGFGEGSLPSERSERIDLWRGRWLIRRRPLGRRDTFGSDVFGRWRGRFGRGRIPFFG